MKLAGVFQGIGSAALLGLAVAVGVLAYNPPADPRPTTDPAANRSLELVTKHDCWTGDSPSDVKVPGHVVVTRPGHTSAEYLGRETTGAALEQEFAGADNGLTVHGFCR